MLFSLSIRGGPGENLGLAGSPTDNTVGKAGLPFIWYSTSDPSPSNSLWSGPDCRHMAYATFCYADGHMAS